jgi:ribosomal protein S18 acetylase RimI-like enzyme
MLVATASLARRIDLAEARMAADFARLAGARGEDVLAVPIGGTVAAFAGPDVPFSKLAGLGLAGVVDEAELAALEREHDARAAPLRVELATLADPGVATLLTRRGYVLVGFENVLGLELSPADGLAPEGAGGDVAVRRAAAGEIAAWIDVVTDGFAHPDMFDGPPSDESFPRATLARVFRDFTVAPGCAQYLALRGGAVAGGGAIRVDGGLAQLCGAATLPAHRRRGVQSALLAGRLADAARAGCDLAVVTTQPGSKSQENVQRAGFVLLYARAILVRHPGAAGLRSS